MGGSNERWAGRVDDCWYPESTLVDDPCVEVIRVVDVSFGSVEYHSPPACFELVFTYMTVANAAAVGVGNQIFPVRMRWSCGIDIGPQPPESEVQSV